MPRRVEGKWRPWRYRIEAEARRGRVVDEARASAAGAKVESEVRSKCVRKDAWRNHGEAEAKRGLGEAEARRDRVETQAMPRRGRSKTEARRRQGRGEAVARAG